MAIMHSQDRRSEEMERRALVSLHEHCPAETREELGLFLEEIGDALVVGAIRDGSILLNRTLGLGTREPVRRETIEAIDETYRKRGVEGRYFLHVYPETLPDGPDTFAGTRLNKARGWMKFWRDDREPPTARSELTVRRVGPDHATDFGRIVAGAFGMTEAAGPLLAGLVDDDRWHCYVSFDGDRPAGAGALMIVDETAWFEWGATSPDFRRRGSQGAIMHARIQAARDSGCTMMFTETGEASGDDPQHSYGNIQRFGFEPSVLRENWSP
jgi:GNAT superfamily N-acetyltransferase